MSVREATPPDISLDDAYAVLADRQRQHLLAVLQEVESSERLSTLARNLAVETDDSSAETAEQIHCRLHHCHVPKLAEIGIVSYGDDQGTVELTDEGRDFVEALDQ